MSSLNDLLYAYLKRITSATSGSTEDLAISALLASLDPEFALSTQLPEGGTTGQVLAKNSANDYDTEWVNVAGDDTYVRVTWFAEITSGTSGTITKPTGSTIVLDGWSGDVDALVSTLPGTTELPSFATAYTSASVAITGTLDVDGNWTLSGTPSAYPVALIYIYRIPITDFDYTKSLDTAVVEPLHDTQKLDASGGTLTNVFETIATETLTADKTVSFASADVLYFYVNPSGASIQFTMPSDPGSLSKSGILWVKNNTGKAHTFNTSPAIRFVSETDADTVPTPAAVGYYTRYTCQWHDNNGGTGFWAVGLAGRDTA